MSLSKTQKVAGIASGLIAFCVPAVFAWDIYHHHLSQNIATWTMIMCLDFLGLTLAFKAGNKRPILQIGWCGAAILMESAILLNRASWHWGWIETVSLICCFVAVLVWQIKDAKWGYWPYMAAMYISTIPQAVDFWHVPIPSTLYVWAWSVVGCAMAIIAAEKRNFENTFVPWGAMLLNVGFCWLVIR